MKESDTFYLSERQLEQLRNYKSKKNPIRVIIMVLLFVISCVSGILLNYVQNYNVQMILTGITGFGGLGCIIIPLASHCNNFPTISNSEKKEISTEEIGRP